MSRDERYRATPVRSEAKPMSDCDKTRVHRRGLADSIQRIACEVFDATVVEREAYPGASFSIRGLADGLDGIRAAALAQSIVRAQLYDYAAQARAAGRTWRDVADALGISDEHGIPAELAYELVVEGRAVPRSRSLWRPTASWTCGSCRRSVIDCGPYDGAPANNESGHDESFPRLQRGGS
jgi:hypothetical protein